MVIAGVYEGGPKAHVCHSRELLIAGVQDRCLGQMSPNLAFYEILPD